MSFTQKPANKESPAEKTKRLCKSVEELNADPTTTNKIGEVMAGIANVCNTIDKVNDANDQLNKGLQEAGNTLAKFVCDVDPFTLSFSGALPTLNDFELCNLAKNETVKNLVSSAEEGFKGVGDSIRKKGEKNFNQLDKCAQKIANLLGADDFSLAKSITGAVGLDMTVGNPLGSLTDCIDGSFDAQKQLNLSASSVKLKSGLALSSGITSLSLPGLGMLAGGSNTIKEVGNSVKELTAVDLCNQDLKIPDIPPVFDALPGNFYVKLMCEIAKNCPDVVAEAQDCVNNYVEKLTDFMPTTDVLGKELNDSIVGFLDETINELTDLSYGETQKLLRACAKAGVIPEDSELFDQILDDVGISL